MKIAVITCYKQPDYVRAKVLRAGLDTLDDVETIVIKNSHTGVWRYSEVMGKVLQARLRNKPDAYIVTFRGYEILPFVLLMALGKPVILDELVNPLLVVSEHRKQRAGTFVGRLMAVWNIFGTVYYWLLRRCRLVLADTRAQAEYSALHARMDINKFVVIPVSTDEDIFRPASEPVSADTGFEVFYYSTMQALHGLEYVIEAAALLKDRQDITFRIVGGNPRTVELIKEAVKAGARIRHESWIQFNELPAAMQGAGVVLGGPFGNTIQAQAVVTGKTYQSLACGAPTIVGESKVSELFTDKENCLMVPQGSARAIADAVVWAAEHRPELNHIGVSGRRLYEEKFSNLVVANDLRKVIGILSGKSAGSV